MRLGSVAPLEEGLEAWGTDAGGGSGCVRMLLAACRGIMESHDSLSAHLYRALNMRLLQATAPNAQAPPEAGTDVF